MRQLIWKEWHEQAWKLAFGCIVLSAFALIGLRTRIILDQEMALWVCFPAMCLLPLLAATGLIPAERSAATLESLAALPVSMRTIAAVKAITGVVLSTVPLLCAMAISLAIAGGREMEPARLAGIYLLCTMTSLSLFFWMFALTIRLPTESRAAMVGVGILMCWGMLTVGLQDDWRYSYFLPPMECLSPYSFVLELEKAGIGWKIILDVAVGFAIGVALWFGASRAIGKDASAKG